MIGRRKEWMHITEEGEEDMISCILLHSGA